MSADPNNKESQTKQIENQGQIMAEGLGKIFQSGLKVNRPTKIIFKDDQTKEILRTARSGSVKQKLNLENTKLKINIQNLSTLITVHEQNQARLKVELDRYKEKLSKYKQKIKQKDNIIIKLLQKLQKRIQLDGKNIQNLILKLHQQQIKSFKQKIHKGQQIDPKDILNKYEQLLKGFIDQQKDKLYLQKQKEDLQKTVLELRQTIKYIGDGNQNKKQKESSQLKAQLADAQAILEKEKQAREKLLQTIANANIQIVPQLKVAIRDIQKQRYLAAKNTQPAKIQSSSQQISNLKRKLAQNETNLWNQRDIQRENQRKYNKIQQQFNKLSEKFVKSNSNLHDLQRQIENIQSKYAKQLKYLQQKFQIILKDTDNIQRHKAQVQDVWQKFQQTIHNFSQQTAKWKLLENQYQNKIDQYRQNKRFLQDKLEKQTQKRRIFELKLISYDQQSKDIKNSQQRDENVQNQSEVDLQKRLDYMRKQSLSNKKQNQTLNQEIMKQKRTHDLLRKQINYAQQRIFRLQQIIKKQSLGNLLQTVDQHIIGSPKAEDYQPPEQISNEQIKEKTEKQTTNDNWQQLQQKLIDQKIHNNYLQIQLNELRNKNIQLQMNFEEVKKDNELKGSQNIQIIQKLKKKQNQTKRSGISSSGKILERGQKYIEKADIQGDYQVNIFNVNQIPTQIQKLTFEELAVKYQAAKDELFYLKQKIGQTLRSDKRIQRKQSIKSGSQIPHIKPIQILDEKLEQQQNSQDIDDAVYKNINEEMDRLIAKNRQLQQQIGNLQTQFESRFALQQNLNKQLRDKLKSSEQVNGNLSNIVIHLQNQLSKLQNNLDVSGYGQRGSEIMEYSAKRSEDQITEPVSNLNKQIMQKRKQFEDMLKSGDQQSSDSKSIGRQTALKGLQLQIRELQLKLEQQKVKQLSSKPKTTQKIRDQTQCPNCQSLIKINAQLIRKIGKQEQTKQYKNTAVQKQLQQIDKQLRANIATSSQNLDVVTKQNKKLKQMLAELKVQLNFERKEEQDREDQLKNLKQVNEQLISSIHEKEKMLLKLRTESYRQAYQKQGVEGDNTKKIDNILDSYQRKIDQLQNIIKGQQKNEVSVTDLYDTINYLNNECELLKKQNEDIVRNSSKDVIKLPQVFVQVPKDHQQLSKKYKYLSQLVGGLQKLAEQQDFGSINQMMLNNNDLKQRNLMLMKQNNKLQNKIFNFNTKTEQYFNKLNQGKAYQIIQSKDKQIQDKIQQNQNLRKQIQDLTKERFTIFAQNQKISQDLKNIQAHIQKLSGDNKLSPHESTLSTQRTAISKLLQRTSAASSAGQPASSTLQRQMEGNPFNEHAFTLQNIRRKLQKLKNAIQNSSHKARPNYEIQSFRQMPVLEDTIITLLDRLHFVWNLVEQRTNQYNQLRDQMNIISMECMKGAQTDNNQVSKSRQSDDKRQAEIIEERYQQVLAQLIEYQNQNKRLQKQVNRLKQQVAIYKRQIQQVQTKYISELRSQSSQQAPYNQQLLNKLLESGSGVVTNASQRQIPEIIKLFLGRIKQLQSHLESIQTQFDQKNQRLQSIIQKQKSFISEKSKVQRGSDDSASFSKRQIQTERDKIDARQQLIGSLSGGIVSPGGVIDQKSYFSLNSARVFKQIEELTRMNEELKQKKYKYRNLLEVASRNIQTVINKLGNQLSEQLKDQLMKFINISNIQLEQDSKKDNSGFDLEGDYILSSSFAQKSKEGIKNQNQQLDQIKKTLQSPRTNEVNEKIRKNEQFDKKVQKNIKFLDENKFLLNQLLQKINKQSKEQQDVDNLKYKMASKLTDKQIQQILYLTDPNQAAVQILTLLSEPQKQQKRVTFQDANNSPKNLQYQQQHSQSIQQGEWVETEQLEAIINQIYPNKSQLCIIVANSINMLMLAQTKEGILKAVQFLFSSLKKKQNEIRQEMKRRDQSVNEYGRKLQKLLQSKISEQESQNKSQLLNENSLRKTTQFKSEYLIKKQEGDQSFNQSQSQSLSGFLQK